MHAEPLQACLPLGSCGPHPGRAGSNQATSVNHPHTRLGFPGGSGGKGPTCQCRRHKRRGFNPWVGMIPGGGHGNPLQYSGESHGQRSLAGCSPRGHSQTRLKHVACTRIHPLSTY